MYTINNLAPHSMEASGRVKESIVSQTLTAVGFVGSFFCAFFHISGNKKRKKRITEEF